MKFSRLLTFALIGLFSLTLITSCSIVKKDGILQSKRYKLSRHVVKRKKSIVLKKNKESLSLLGLHGDEKMKSQFQTQQLSIAEQSKTLSLSVDKRMKSIPTLIRNVIPLVHNELPSTLDSCDIIIYKNGNEVPAKVLEIGTKEITYKRCSNLTGPNIVVNRSEVLLIRYPDGSKDIITQAEQSKDKSSNKGLGWFLIIIGFLVLLFLSIVVGVILGAIGIAIVVSRN